MKCFLLFLLICLLENSFGFPTRPFYANESTLQLVHVLYRHGDRTPDQVSLYPGNPYYDESNYLPYKYGQLINKGKRREFNIGAALRKRYNKFLGNEWNINILDTRSTNYNRTKMSAQLMLAGLWPPTGTNIWEPLVDWQPIPYNYETVDNDKELSPFLGCPGFLRRLADTMATPEISSYLSSRYNETLNILSDKTGVQMTYLEAFLLYFGFLIQEQLYLPLEEWTKAVYPEPLRSLTVDYYYLQTNNTELRKVIPGYFLKKLITDTQMKIDGTLNPPDRKMFIYSAHETNIATLLLGLDVLKITDVPPYGSYVLCEIHQIAEVYGIKLFYQDYSNTDPQLLAIPGCADFCPISEFITLVEEILPSSDAECFDSQRDITEL